MKDINHLHTCSFCQNDWSIKDGFNLKTKQCASCDKYDLEEPEKEKERDRHEKWWQEEGRFMEIYFRSNR
jgi:hypothetical protein